MKTAIIILNYNDSENTIKLVNVIEKYKLINKILIVDNNSKKKNEYKVLKKRESDKVEVIKTDKNGGYSYGNNYGLKYLDEKYKDEFKYVIISNPDIFVEEESIKKCIENLEKKSNVAICAPRMNFLSGPARRAAWKKRSLIIDIANSTRISEFLLYPIFKSGEYTKKEYEQEILDVENIAGSFFIAKFNVFKEIDFFDTNTFLFYEEDILSEKLREKGYKIQILNKEKFLHFESQTIGKTMNVLKKIDILFDSKKYFHKEYNKVGIFGCFIIELLRCLRKFELIVEVPIRKIIKK